MTTTYPKLVLGGTAIVKTLGGKSVELNIPSGTQVGSVLRIPGEGLPRSSSSTSRGDMFVRVRIEVPKKVTDEERELLMKLDGSASTGKKGKKKSILDKITDTVTGSK